MSYREGQRIYRITYGTPVGKVSQWAAKRRDGKRAQGERNYTAGGKKGMVFPQGRQAGLVYFYR